MTDEETVTLTIPDVTLDELKVLALHGWTHSIATKEVEAAKAALEQYERECQPYYVSRFGKDYELRRRGGGRPWEVRFRGDIPKAEQLANELCDKLNAEASRPLT